MCSVCPPMSSACFILCATLVGIRTYYRPTPPGELRWWGGRGLARVMPAFSEGKERGGGEGRNLGHGSSFQWRSGSTQGAPLMFKGVIVLRPRFGGGRMDYEVECWEVNMLLLLLLS